MAEKLRLSNNIKKCCGKVVKVLETRYTEGLQVRRKECVVCKQRFSTYEISSCEFNNFVAIEDKATALVSILDDLRGVLYETFSAG